MELPWEGNGRSLHELVKQVRARNREQGFGSQCGKTEAERVSLKGNGQRSLTLTWISISGQE